MLPNDEPDINDARLGFLDAQAALSGVTRRLPGLFSCCMYGTNVSDERGSFGLVSTGGPLEDLVGDIVKVVAGGRSVFVLITGATTLPCDLGLARRPFGALTDLWSDNVKVTVEVVE